MSTQVQRKTTTEKPIVLEPRKADSTRVVSGDKNNVTEPILEFKSGEATRFDVLPEETNIEKKETKKNLFPKIAACVISIVLAGIAGVASSKAIKLSKELDKTKKLLADTIADLDVTKVALQESKDALAQMQKLPKKQSLKDTFLSAVRNATECLKDVNKLGSECNQLCSTVGNIKKQIV